MIIVTSYENPDTDGCGGALAYAELLRAQGKDAEARFFAAPSLEAQYIFTQLKEIKLIPFSATLDDEIVLVDASESPYLHFLPTFEKVMEVIDHRKINDVETFKNAKVQIELVGAADTLVTERFVQAKITPSPEVALFMYSGIVSNTLNFQSPNHTERDVKMAEWLKAAVY